MNVQFRVNLTPELQESLREMILAWFQEDVHNKDVLDRTNGQIDLRKQVGWRFPEGEEPSDENCNRPFTMADVQKQYGGLPPFRDGFLYRWHTSSCAASVTFPEEGVVAVSYGGRRGGLNGYDGAELSQFMWQLRTWLCEADWAGHLTVTGLESSEPAWPWWYSKGCGEALPQGKNQPAPRKEKQERGVY